MVATRILPGSDPAAITEAARLIRAGRPVAFPTETVYGLGADALDPVAVARVFAAKDRPAFDPLIVHIARAGDLAALVDPSDAGDPRLLALADAFWPGPLTVVLRKLPTVPSIVTAGLESVGVRVPDHAIAQALIAEAGVPIAAPSANRFGRVSPTRAEHVLAQLDGRVGLILDGGQSRVGLESTVIRLADGDATLLRPGGLPSEAIERLIGPLRRPGDEADSRSLAPGRSLGHYAPGPPVVVVAPTAAIAVTAAERVGLLAADETGRRSAEATGGPFAAVEVLSADGESVEQAARLFDALHRLADARLDRIVAQAVPEVGLGRAIMDRLRRAAAA